MTAPEVRHDRGAGRFSIRLPEGEAELTYEEPRRGVLDLQHTFVPDDARGEGIGEALVEAAIAYARETGARIIPTCPFVRTWRRRHREHGELIARDY
jgi:predicted GNAT family acetyltransferase